ncbi:MAG: hypothetical protein ACYTF6_04280 [Planctomycetota bacterium]|jgi:hypothetical protein
MSKRQKIPRAELAEMLNGMAMLVDWHGQLVSAALELLGEGSQDKGRGSPLPRGKPRGKSARRGKSS